MARSRLLIWVRNAAVLAIIVAFVVVFGQPGGSSGIGAVAEVNGEPIRRDVYEFFRDQTATRTRDLVAPGADAVQVQNLIDQQTLNSLIYRHVTVQEARALGLRVSEKELAAALLANPDFQQNGRFDPQLFEANWRRAGLETDRIYAEEHRRDLLIQKFQRLVGSPVRVSDAVIRETLERERLRIRLRYAVPRGETFLDPLEIGAEEVSRFAQDEPERLLRAYQARQSEFNQPERVRASHILFIGPEALEEAEAAHQRLLGGEEDFAAVARELSEDPATREEGGDLGFFPRGRMLSAFEEVAFALTPGTLSGPVETERGIHLIRLSERQDAVAKTLDDVSEQLARDLLLVDHRLERARQAAEEMLERLAEGADFDQTAAALDLQSGETVSFGSGNAAVPGIGRVPGLKEAALALRPEQPHAVRAFGDGNAFYVISLLERHEPDAETIAAEAPAIRERLETQARSQLLSEWSESRLAQLQRAGKLVRFPLYPTR